MSLLFEGINLCKKGAMSVCSANNEEDQEKCTFYKKASQENRCMYFIFDEFCDCMEAQLDKNRD